MSRRRSLAVLLLMVGLTLAPGLARAAIACAPHCCPASAATTGGDDFGKDALGRAGDDCRSAFASRTCCADATAPLATFASVARSSSSEAIDELASAPALLPTPIAGLVERLRLPARGAEALLSLRTSPLRRSVVLLI